MSPLVGSSSVSRTIGEHQDIIPTFVIESNSQHQYHWDLEIEGDKLKGLAHKTPLQHTPVGLENYPEGSWRYFVCNM